MVLRNDNPVPATGEAFEPADDDAAAFAADAGTKGVDLGCGDVKVEEDISRWRLNALGGKVKQYSNWIVNTKDLIIAFCGRDTGGLNTVVNGTSSTLSVSVSFTGLARLPMVPTNPQGDLWINRVKKAAANAQIIILNHAVITHWKCNPHVKSLKILTWGGMQ